ncbi:hypothetical protein [Streptomyces sp. NPDC005374]|uniref:hypothetical protein n=1 Tax=Streptomyces sp. NPDC005374 TaxID=3364713 RepID=UPI0036C1DD2C
MTGLIIGVWCLSEGVGVLGMISMALGAIGLVHACSADAERRAADRSRKVALARPFVAPLAEVGDLIIIESIPEDGCSPFVLCTVAAVDGDGRVAAVTNGQGETSQLTTIRPRLVSLQTRSAAEVDVADAMSRELHRSEVGRQWTSRAEVIAQFRPASASHGDTFWQ